MLLWCGQQPLPFNFPDPPMRLERSSIVWKRENTWRCIWAPRSRSIYFSISTIDLWLRKEAQRPWNPSESIVCAFNHSHELLITNKKALKISEREFYHHVTVLHWTSKPHESRKVIRRLGAITMKQSRVYLVWSDSLKAGNTLLYRCIAEQNFMHPKIDSD